MIMFKCLKDVQFEGDIFFKKDKLYRLFREDKDGYVVLDEDFQEHVIGGEGVGWFNEHFETISDEDELSLMSEYYSNMPDHDKEEREYIQRHIDREIDKATKPLIEALKYYANKENYRQGYHDLLGTIESDVQMDEGEVARKALGEV